MKILACPDKFKGTASAAEVAEAVCTAAAAYGHDCRQLPLADGGEGTTEALGGANRTSVVTGPHGGKTNASWRLDGDLAVIEMAEAAGLVVAGGPESNNPIEATTRGVGELIGEAVALGARRIIVGVGGSATTDGGAGAIEAIGSVEALNGVELTVACDVRTLFVDAARVFAPQKGATPVQVGLLERRLIKLVDDYRAEFGVDVSQLPRGGAAGGLAGGLAALGAELVAGFDLVAEISGLRSAMAWADLVVTGEGMLDSESFAGKVVGGVVAMGAESDVPVVVIAGQVRPDDVSGHAPIAGDDRMRVISLADVFGIDESMTDTLDCVASATVALVSGSEARRS